MAVVTVKSKAITNRDATPQVLSNPALQNAEVREAVGVFAIGATDSTGSIYKIASLPSNARVTSIKISTDAAMDAMVCKLGLYDVPTVNSGAAIGSADQFGTVIDLHTAAVANSEQLFHTGASAQTIANGEKMLWDTLALASDPGKFYDLALTATTGNSTTGCNCQVRVQYVV